MNDDSRITSRHHNTVTIIITNSDTTANQQLNPPTQVIKPNAKFNTTNDNIIGHGLGCTKWNGLNNFTLMEGGYNTHNKIKKLTPNSATPNAPT